MQSPDIQNFSIPADNDAVVTFLISSDVVGDTLSGCIVYWNAYEQELGLPTVGVEPVIAKSSLSGHGIEILESPPMTFQVVIDAADSVDLLRNYYHEATIVDEFGDTNTVTVGIMTVTGTENRT